MRYQPLVCHVIQCYSLETIHPDVFMFLSCLLPDNIARPLLQLIMHDEDDAVFFFFFSQHVMVQVSKLTERDSIMEHVIL